MSYPSKNAILRIVYLFPVIVLVLFTQTSAAISENFTLSQPFGPDGSTYRITSYFDHAYPNYGTYNGVTIYNGENSADFSPYSYQGHPGYDFGMPSGTIIKAAADGIVRGVEFNCDENQNICDNFGNYVCIEHDNGMYSLYGHMTTVYSDIRQIGTHVTSGQDLGTSGNTGHSDGAHLHFGVYKGDNCLHIPAEINPIDPFGWQGDYPDPQLQLTQAVGGANAPCLWKSDPHDPISCFDNIYEDMATYFYATPGWTADPFGNGYHRYYRKNTTTDNDYAAWTFSIHGPTAADVYVWIPAGTETVQKSDMTHNAKYKIRTSSGDVYTYLDQTLYSNEWVGGITKIV